MSKPLPETYKPFEEVWVCGNIFRNGSVIFEVDKSPVFLIGRDDDSEKEARVWLNIPIDSGRKPVWKNVIENNEIKDENFGLENNKFGQGITFQSIPIIQFRVFEGQLVVTLINLQPIGLNIVGGLQHITISGSKIQNNTFENVGTMIGIGG